ncbi:MAG: Transcription initiation factor TFIID subunit 9 [Claussenomyces sp. TS43310]|nr:MAG: Transcription initiation factor TFIID subunit 9 [Claussenomyces sp. TS43310]
MADVNGTTAPTTNGRAASSPPSQPPPIPPASNPASAPFINPSVPQTSLQDNGSGKRPRDARLVHMLLSSLGVTAYQERVPLQLLDFAYRHTSSILSDALHLSSDAYISQQTRARDAPAGGSLKDADGQVSMSAIQLAIQSRLQYQFNGGSGGGLSKEFLLETAEARNKVGLPRIQQNEWGLRLPNEKFILNGVPWTLRDDWEGEPEEEEDGDQDVVMGLGGPDGDEKDGGEEAEEGGTAGDLFGEDFEDDNMNTEDS